MKSEGFKQVKKVMESLAKRGEEPVKKALNRVGDGVATEANRRVRQEYTVKAGDVKNTIRVKKGNGTEVDVISKGGNFALPKFKVNLKTPRVKGDKPKVLKAAVKKGGGKKMKSAFVAKMKSGHVGVFNRGPSSSKRKKNSKGDFPGLPIDEGFGPGAPVMLNNREVVKHVEKEAEQRMKTRLDHEIGRILK